MGKSAKKWSYNAGEKGRNWVRAYEDNKTEIILVEFFVTDPNTSEKRRTRQSLGHRDRILAKQQADEIAARFGGPEKNHPSDLTLRELFDNYLREVTPTKSDGKQEHDRRCAAMFLEFLGANKQVLHLNVRDWMRFISARSDGSVGPSENNQPVGNRQIEYDLRFLLAVLNWATKARADGGQVLLVQNPLKGLPLPKERNPRRPVLNEGIYRAMVAVSYEMDWRFRVALVLANETGHRIGAVRQLQWSDIDLKSKRIHWRSERDKMGFDHVTPITEQAVDVLRAAQRENQAIGESWVLPSPCDANRPCSRSLMANWWKKAERSAGLVPEPGRGWHSLRRKFATELKDVPLVDVCWLGGWKSPQTLLRCYQTADETRMREALSNRQDLLGVGAI